MRMGLQNIERRHLPMQDFQSIEYIDFVIIGQL